MLKYLLIIIALCVTVEAHAQETQETIYFPEDLENGDLANELAKRDYENLMNRADALYNQNEFQDAGQIYSLIIRKEPYHAPAYFGRANCREQMGDFEGALADFRSVHHIDPEMTEAFFSSAVLEYNLGDYSAAVSLFSKLLELPEGATQAIYFKGVQYSPSSEPMLTGVQSMAGDRKVIIHHYLGKSYNALRDYPKSEDHFSRAIAMSPSAELYLDRGLMRKDGFSKEEALADLKTAVRLEPDNSLALYWLADLARQSGDESLTMEALDKVLAGNYAFPEAYIQRGMLKYKAGDFKEAIADFDSAISISTEIPEAYVNRGLAKDKIGNFSGAIQDFNRAIRMNSTDAQAFQFRGNTWFKMKKFEEAIKDYNTSIRLDEENAKLFYNRALAKNNLQDDDLDGEVCTDLQTAIELGMEEAIATRKDICEKK